MAAELYVRRQLLGMLGHLADARSTNSNRNVLATSISSVPPNNTTSSTTTSSSGPLTALSSLSSVKATSVPSQQIPLGAATTTISYPTFTNSSLPSDTTSNHSVKTSSAVILGVVGGIVGLIVLLLFVYLVYRKNWLRKDRYTSMSQKEEALHIEPFISNPWVESIGTLIEDANAAAGEVSQLEIFEVQPRNTVDTIPWNGHLRESFPEPLCNLAPWNRKFGDSDTPPIEVALPTDGEEELARQMTEMQGIIVDLQSEQNIQAESNSQELTRQMTEMQETIVDLRSRLIRNTQVDSRATEQRIPPTNDPDMRQEIMILRSEIERLQTSQEELIRIHNNMERLPDYEEAF